MADGILRGLHLQCGTIMTLISPGDHTPMWHAALKSWQWIHQVAAPYDVIRGSAMTCHWIRPNVRHIGILHLVTISTTSPQSTCYSATVSDILSKSDNLRQKKMTSCPFSRWRISAILDFRGAIMGSLKAHVRLPIGRHRDHSSKLFSFWENHVFFILATDRQTNKRTDGHHRCTKPLSLSWAAA